MECISTLYVLLLVCLHVSFAEEAANWAFIALSCQPPTSIVAFTARTKVAGSCAKNDAQIQDRPQTSLLNTTKMWHIGCWHVGSSDVAMIDANRREGRFRGQEKSTKHVLFTRCVIEGMIKIKMAIIKSCCLWFHMDSFVLLLPVLLFSPRFVSSLLRRSSTHSDMHVSRHYFQPKGLRST